MPAISKENPKVTLWDKIKAHFPGGSKKVDPTKMTCADYTFAPRSALRPARC